MKAYLEIELPKSCCECDIKSWDGEDDVCPFSGISALSIGRQDDCPLVPVPPHGRLGDLDAAAELAMQYCPDDDGTCSKAGVDLRELLDEIESLPTIIPADRNLQSASGIANNSQVIANNTAEEGE